MTEKELLGLTEFLATYPDEFGAFLRNVPWDDEPLTEEDEKVLAECEEWLRQDGGKGRPGRKNAVPPGYCESATAGTLSGTRYRDAFQRPRPLRPAAEKD